MSGKRNPELPNSKLDVSYYSRVIQTVDGTTTVINPGNQVVYMDSAYPSRRRYRGYGWGYTPLLWPYYF